MDKEQAARFEELVRMQRQLKDATTAYWFDYSNMGTWQFWFLLAMIVVPLAALYFLLDRRRALLIVVYGLNVHLWFHYADILVVTLGGVHYPYKLIPFLPTSLTLDTALVPVSYMLLYQWTLNRNKNYWIYATGLSAFFSFALKPAMTAAGLFRLYWADYYELFIYYLAIMTVSKLLTDLFRRAQERAERVPRDGRRWRKLRLDRRLPFRPRAR